MRCPACGGYEFNSDGKCKFCGYSPASEPRYTIGEGVDVWRLQQGLIAKREIDRRNKIPKRSNCLYCKEHSLFYDDKNDKFECLNIKCSIFNKPISQAMPDYDGIINSLLKGK